MIFPSRLCSGGIFPPEYGRERFRRTSLKLHRHGKILRRKSHTTNAQYALRGILLSIAVMGTSLFAGPAQELHAETVTEESIKEKESQIEDAKKQQESLKQNVSDIQAMQDSLEASKSNLETYVSDLDSQLNEIQAKIDDLKSQIEDKEAEIDKTQTELEEAEATQKAQYEAMKKRIRFIYEKGNTYYVELLLKASSFGDMLNKAYYVNELSEYDQRKLEEYKQQTQLVELTKQALEEEQQTLEDAKSAQEEEENNMQTLIADKTAEITSLEGQIADSEADLDDAESALNQQTSEISALEASVAADKQTLAAQQQQKQYSGGAFTWPCPSYTYISSDFGYRIHPISGVEKFHSGIDMAAPYGSAILAAADGTVVSAGYSSSMGNYVMINHGGGLYTIYMHASALYVSSGQSVSAGEQIAAVGSTGNSTGPHLHFSVRLSGSYVSPWNYL